LGSFSLFEEQDNTYIRCFIHYRQIAVYADFKFLLMISIDYQLRIGDFHFLTFYTILTYMDISQMSNMLNKHMYFFYNMLTTDYK